MLLPGSKSKDKSDAGKTSSQETPISDEKADLQTVAVPEELNQSLSNEGRHGLHSLVAL